VGSGPTALSSVAGPWALIQGGFIPYFAVFRIRIHADPYWFGIMGPDPDPEELQLAPKYEKITKFQFSKSSTVFIVGCML